jgi:ATP-dependent protease ClpP protease subunit
MFRLTGSMTDESQERLFTWLLKMRASNHRVLTIVIDSPGGGVFGALNAVKLLKEMIQSGRIVTTYANFASSAAALLFLAGNVRLINPGSIIHFHPVIIDIPVYAIDARRRIPEKDYEVGRQLQVGASDLLACKTCLGSIAIDKIMSCKGGRTFQAAEALKFGIATGYASEELQ